MQKHLSIVAAAALAVGGMGLTAAWAQDQAPAAGQSTPSDSLQRAGDNAQTAADKAAAGQGLKGTAQAPDAEGIRDVLASATEAAFTPGGFDDLVERFVDADRNRIGKAMPSDDDLKAHNEAIKSFRDAWKEKYGKEFDIDSEELVFNEQFQIQQGEIGAAARTASERTSTDRPADPAGASGSVSTPAGGASGSVTVDANAPKDAADRATDATANAADRTAQQAKSVDSPSSPAADANRNDPGRNIATVQVPASHGLSALTVNMVHEFPDAWRIDVPDTVDAAKLRTNLGNAVNACMAMKDQWPADVNEAYRAVGHKVLLAVHDQPISAGAGAGTGAGAAPTTP